MTQLSPEKNARAIDLSVSRYVKRSRAQRKFVNEMRAMGDVPWPARRFRVAPTFAGGMVVGRCPRVVGSTRVRRKRLRRAEEVAVVCGGDLLLVAYKGVHCVSCRDRNRQRKALIRLQQMARVPVHSREAKRERAGFAGRVRGVFRRSKRGA